MAQKLPENLTLVDSSRNTSLLVNSGFDDAAQSNEDFLFIEARGMGAKTILVRLDDKQASRLRGRIDKYFRDKR